MPTTQKGGKMRPAEYVSDVGILLWKKEHMLHCKSTIETPSQPVSVLLTHDFQTLKNIGKN
jgi:hypothetical protein